MNNDYFKSGMFKSILLHALLALYIIFSAGTGGSGTGGDGKGGNGGDGEDPNGKGNSQEDSREILDKKEKEKEPDLEVEILNKDALKKKETKPPSADEGIEDCVGDMWFGGIGVNISGNLITAVFKGYPAYQSGLKAGDRVLSPDPSQIKGEPDTYIVVTVDRNGEQITVSMFRAKVCVDAANPKENP